MCYFLSFSGLGKSQGHISSQGGREVQSHNLIQEELRMLVNRLVTAILPNGALVHPIRKRVLLETATPAS